MCDTIRPAAFRYQQALDVMRCARDANDAAVYAVAARVCEAVRLGRRVDRADLAILDAFTA